MRGARRAALIACVLRCRQLFEEAVRYDEAAHRGLLRERDGQVYTWNCTTNLIGKGAAASGSPVLLIQTTGSMKQKGGRSITTNEEGSVLFDPRVQMPVLVNEALNFVPPQSVSRYTVQLKLIQYTAH